MTFIMFCGSCGPTFHPAIDEATVAEAQNDAFIELDERAVCHWAGRKHVHEVHDDSPTIPLGYVPLSPEMFEDLPPEAVERELGRLWEEGMRMMLDAAEHDVAQAVGDTERPDYVTILRELIANAREVA